MVGGGESRSVRRRVAGFHGSDPVPGRGAIAWSPRLVSGRRGTTLRTTPSPQRIERTGVMTKLFQYGGIAASIILIAFGAGALYMGFAGKAEVRDNLKREQIVGTPDMAASVANKPVTTGAQAKAFAQGMRKHTLEATQGQTYSQMGRFLDQAGKPTNDEKAAAINPETKKPVENGARNIWVTETAL